MLRKTLKSITLAGFAALSFAAAPVAARAETLADALVAAYRNSNLLEQNRATLRAADEDVAAAIASLRPVVQWIAEATYTDSDVPPRDVEDLSASLSLSASMVLFDFGQSQLGVDIAKESVLATREALVGVEQDVLLTAVAAYTDVKSASQRLAINQNSVRVIGEELRAAQDRFEVGEVTRTDVSLAEARLAAARAAQVAAQGSLEAARESFKAATGAYPVNPAALPKPPVLPKSLDEARATALRLHPAIKRAQRQVTIADLQVALSAKRRMPTISGSVGVSDPSGTGAGLTAGVRMSQTIYSGGALASAHRKAIANRDAARAGLAQVGVQISESVANAWSSIEVARAQIRAINQQIEAATVAYNGVKEEATLGARTTLDVLDAEQELLNAQADRIDAEANLQVAIYSLLSSMGLLTVEKLQLGIPTYDPAAYYNAVRNAPVTSVQGESLDRVLRSIGKK